MRHQRSMRKDRRKFHKRNREIRKTYQGGTTRYCVFCEKMTTFHFNWHIGHSECVECGGREALHGAPSGAPPFYQLMLITTHGKSGTDNPGISEEPLRPCAA